MYHAPDKATQALALLNKALAIYGRVYGRDDKHWGQGFVHLLKGQIYATEGKKEEALASYLRSEHIYTTVLTHEAIDDVSRLYAALVRLGLQTQDQKMVQLYTQEHIRVFGHDHPRTLEIVSEADAQGIKISL